MTRGFGQQKNNKNSSDNNKSILSLFIMSFNKIENRMKRLLIISFAIFVLVAIFTSCKEKQTLLENTWYVTVGGMKIHADSVWIDVYDWDVVTLSFMGKDKYIFQSSDCCVIDRVKIGKNNEIKFEWLRGISTGNKFVGTCFLLLSHINHYEVNGDGLVLTGDNGEIIKFRKVGF